MKYSSFEEIISVDRMTRFLGACGGDSRKGRILYRYDLTLSCEMFKIISYFEVALRNRIDRTLKSCYGNDWLRDSCLPGGIFDTPQTLNTRRIVEKAFKGLNDKGAYTPAKLMAEMEFGVWKYMFSGPQYVATGQKLLSVFPDKPRTTSLHQINNRFIFNELSHINIIRNRIAHHEPICFAANLPIKSVSYAQQEYLRILKLFSWMGIDGPGLLFGNDHVKQICTIIRCL